MEMQRLTLQTILELSDVQLLVQSDEMRHVEKRGNFDEQMIASANLLALEDELKHRRIKDPAMYGHTEPVPYYRPILYRR